MRGLLHSLTSGLVLLLASRILLLSPHLPLCHGWDEGSGGMLNVYVVPHSHNDPGWWKTFEGYYQDWTKGIISSVVEILDEDISRTFVWAEISYFQRWWDDQPGSVRDTVKKLVQNGQLEFVTAGWVMNDEANTHVVDIINQLTEGHEWLYNTLNTKPKYGWAIDPFGHSPTMPYVLQQMGFEAIVINRAHRQIKQEFRDSKHLEFIWTGDLLNSSSSFNMLTHIFPWKLYDIPNTCGPDRDLCATFDFERPESVAITSNNVKERSEILVNSYKEKAKLFRHNSVLIPLGDDFKYKNPDITRKIMTQYEMMFKYINSATDLGVNIKFSTLGQYFEDIQSELTEVGGNVRNEEGQHSTPGQGNGDLFPGQLPPYQGDFFTYCDEGQDYWSGYFTTRPFMKGLTRSTQAILRTGEILATLARSYAGESLNRDQWGKWFDGLQKARRNIALFQHHDGVTGTARRAVVEDYAKRLLDSLADVAEYSSDMALVVLSKSADKSNIQKGEGSLSWVTEPAKKISLATSRVVKVEKDGAVIVVFNPLAHPRIEVVSVLVDTHEVEVTDDTGETVVAQVDPVWDGDKPSSTQFTLHFVSNIPGIGLATYFVRPSRHATLASVTEYSSSSASGGDIAGDWRYESKSLDASNSIIVENSMYRVTLGGYGTIKTITRVADSTTTAATAEVDQEFLTYGSRGGAYLFLPHGQAKPLQLGTRAVRVIRGPIVVAVHSVHTDTVKEHILRLYTCSSPNTQQTNNVCSQARGLELVHIVDLTKGDTEVVTKFKTNIANSGRFFTDSNGLEMRERDYDSNLPIQGNYYPITSAAFIQSRSPKAESARLTVLSHQAHGVASLNEGELEVMLDRRLNSDDGRGLGESITDNVRTSIPLWLVLEAGPSDSYNSYAHPALSATASDIWHTRNYPMHILYSHTQPRDSTSLQDAWGSTHHLKIDPLASSIHERLQLFSFAPRDKESNDIVLRVFYPPVKQDLDSSNSQPLEIFDANMFKSFKIANLQETSLSLLHEIPSADDTNTEYSISPTEIRTWLIRLELSPVETNVAHENTQKHTTQDSETKNIASGNEKDEGIAKEEVKPNNLEHNDRHQNPPPKPDTIPNTKTNKGSFQNEREEHKTEEKHRSGGEGRVGKQIIEDASKIKDQAAKETNTTGLYTMSIMFYLGLLVVVVVGGWLLGRRTRTISEDKRTAPRLPTVWKEREDSMMKLL